MFKYMNSGTENVLLASAGVIRFTSTDSATMSNISFSMHVKQTAERYFNKTSKSKHASADQCVILRDPNIMCFL